MTRKAVVVLSLLPLTLMALAGCTSDLPVNEDGAIEGKVDATEYQLKVGKGAISGLLVDDRFRPLHLVNDPVTEFQAKGFILLQETGQQVRTSANGEFAFVDLEPGAYTLRVTIERHEVTPVRVTVQEGLFAEASIVARRVSSVGSLILTEEYSGFVTCAVVVPVVTVTFNCADGSGESYRTAAATDHSALANVTYMIIESMLVGDPDGAWMLTVRHNDGTSLGGTNYANRYYGEDDTDYVKVILWNNETDVYNPDYNTNPWNNSLPMNSISFYQGTISGAGYSMVPMGMEACQAQNDVAQTINDATPPPVPNVPVLNCGFNTFGTGATFAQRTQFIISVFIGEVQLDLESYRLLTPDST